MDSTTEIDLSSYRLVLLNDDGDRSLYRAYPPAGPTTLLVLLPTPATKNLPHFNHLAGELDPDWATPVLGSTRLQGRLGVVCADPGGTPLTQRLGRPMELGNFLRLASGIASATREMHAQGLVHNTIQPSNVLVDDAGRAWLTGFDRAARQTRQRDTPAPPDPARATLTYMAPEQTGRVNRPVDTRSDLYSLGVTLYEMLAGQPPFTASDPLEWIHCHVAREPPPLRQHLADLPPVVDRMVLRLLAKRPEDRYQTALGLEADLRRCLQRLSAEGHITGFRLGRVDRADRVHLPKRLYGRAGHLDRLFEAFNRVSSASQPEVVVVSGRAGVGKSSLVAEFRREVTSRGSLFAGGKFDQYKQDIPHASIIEALQGLIRHLLTLDESELARWRQNLLDALGGNAGLMINLIPELALVIGPQPLSGDLPSRPGRNRFHVAFRQFLGVFARAGRPLVLFIDDAQWLDIGTIELMETIARTGSVKHLLLICAYRDDEVQPDDPLARALDAIRGERRLSNVHIDPLAPVDLEHLVSDALNSSDRSARPLAKLIFQKTDGNPLFASQFLTALADEQLVVFDYGANAWTWDAGAIAAKPITENVADLITGRLSRLPEPTLHALKRFACLGTATSPRLLRTILRHSRDALAEALRPAIAAGFVLQTDSEFRFAHDRIREAVYGLIPEAERPSWHLAVARSLAAALTPAEIEDRVFEVVNQFDRGRAAGSSRKDRLQVAALHLRAGKRAKAMTAYTSAVKYLSDGAALLGPRDWARHYPLVFAVELHRAECEFLTGQHAVAEGRLLGLMDRAQGLVDSAAVTAVLLALYTTLGNTIRAVEVGLAYLRRVGVEWNINPTDETVTAELQLLNGLRADRPIAQLIELPRMTDPTWLAAMDVLAWLILPALITDRNLEAVILLRMASISLQQGNCDASCYAYSQINVVLALRFGDFPSGRDFGRLGRDLVDHHAMDRFKARVYTCFSCYVAPWSEHLPASVPLTRTAIQLTAAAGDPVFMVATYRSLVATLLVAGAPLDEVQREAEHYLALARKTGFSFAADAATSVVLLVRELRSAIDDVESADTLARERRQFEQHLVDGGAPLILVASWYGIHRMEASYLLGNHAAAMEAKLKAEATMSANKTFLIEVADYHFYGALVQASHCETAAAEERQDSRQSLDAHYRQIATWARHCPENFGARAALLAAEIARVDGGILDAFRLYEDAVRQAREFAFVQVEAIASERAASLHSSQGLKASADSFLQNARECYLRWGAIGKVGRLDRLHPHLGAAAVTPHESGAAPMQIERLDLSAVVAMTQAVSSEIVLDRLIERLMVTVIEHAGAVRGLLLLPHDGAMRPAAEARTRNQEIIVDLTRQPDSAPRLPHSVLNYVVRTREPIILNDASGIAPYSSDPYIVAVQPHSVLCLPLVKQAQLVAVLYLENDLSSDLFTSDQLPVLRVIASQAAISIQNAELYRDVETSREQTRQAAGELRKWLDMIPALAWRASTEGALEFANKQWHDYTGIPPEAAMGGGWVQSFHPGDSEKVIAKWKTILDQGMADEIEARIRRWDGVDRTFLIRATPLRDDTGTIVKWYGTSTDIDDLKRLQDAQRALANVERLTALGTLTVSIAHEVNQPLMAIVTDAATCLRWLSEDRLDIGEARKAAERIVRDGHRAGEVVASIRALARRSSTEMARVDLREVVLETLTLVRGEAVRRNVTAELDLGDADLSVVGNRVRIQQVLLNLLMNGMEAMEAVHDRPRKLCLNVRPERADRIAITVSDTGAGLDPSVAEKLFEPFFTTKPEGIGLGLSICRSIIEAHGGRFWTSANAPHGASFHFTLPRWTEADVRSRG